MDGRECTRATCKDPGGERETKLLAVSPMRSATRSARGFGDGVWLREGRSVREGGGSARESGMVREGEGWTACVSELVHTVREEGWIATGDAEEGASIEAPLIEAPSTFPEAAEEADGIPSGHERGLPPEGGGGRGGVLTPTGNTCARGAGNGYAIDGVCRGSSFAGDERLGSEKLSAHGEVNTRILCGGVQNERDEWLPPPFPFPFPFTSVEAIALVKVPRSEDCLKREQYTHTVPHSMHTPSTHTHTHTHTHTTHTHTHTTHTHSPAQFPDSPLQPPSPLPTAYTYRVFAWLQASNSCPSVASNTTRPCRLRPVRPDLWYPSSGG